MAASSTTQGEWYTVDCGGNQFTLPVRYQDLDPIGHGSFGAVIRATDTKTGEQVAIKKMLRPFQNETYSKQTYRELKLLMYLNHPDAQVVQLYNVFTPEKNVNDFKTLYFVFNFADYNLDQVIRHRKPFTEEHIRQIIYSLLRGLKFIHSAGILHRDLKPSNIGMDKLSNVTILDFGLARVLADHNYTTYVATRWWRAPEVVINPTQYTEKLDIWSVGCIMAELILLRPVFPGSDHIDQLHKTLDIVGTPDLTTLHDICTPANFTYISQLPLKVKQDYNELFGFKYNQTTQIAISGVSPEGVDLLDRLLSFDYRVRPTAEEALAHPFLRDLHDPMYEPTTEPMVDEHENANYSIAHWKSIVWQMIAEFLPPSWVTDDLVDENMS